MKPKLTIVKIGGNVIDDPEMLQTVLKEFGQLEGAKLLVHGGGKIASDISKRLKIPTQMVDGRRITDAATLEVVTMVYGGLVNKNVIAILQSYGTDAIGLTGADANTIPANKRPVNDIDYGFVGDIDTSHINTERLSYLIDGGLVPVFCALTHDNQGHLLNTNADTMASSLAIALSEGYDTELIYCFEKNGVLLDVEDDNTLIRELNYLHFQQLKDDGVIHQGMIPKLDNAFLAKRQGVNVTVKHALNLTSPLGTSLL
ncbi:acetylglutamate kinase [Fulvivirga ligni]|uniref:acetylglutamate kinase n=1 Tax=Fulvivirga ligni TaxID=2904246 RepID=UPI001F3DD993|nr:acetylglutamate kinase [Fulvivirga ligni]UII23654.1 acetylglutamate kinase [Fulvivirga ligni]